jgi:hypothetical protein
VIESKVEDERPLVFDPKQKIGLKLIGEMPKGSLDKNDVKKSAKAQLVKRKKAKASLSPTQKSSTRKTEDSRN